MDKQLIRNHNFFIYVLYIQYRKNDVIRNIYLE